MRLIYATTLILLQLTLTNMAHASASTFIDNGSYTTDTTSGLDWYDVSLTKGLNYNEVIALTSTGGTLEGENWHYATATEFQSMLGNFLDLAPSGFYNSNNGTLSQLVDMLGTTEPNPNGSIVNGRLININTSTSTNTPPFQLDLALIATTETSYQAISHNGVISNSTSDLTAGSFLVRSTLPASPVPVPVPAAIWLMGTGLIGLTSFSRRKLYTVSE